MRRRNIKSHKKLSIILIVFVSFFLKANEDETNIVCFATKNKWVCAPEDQQHIASEKAEKLIDIHKSEVGSSEVVIKSINIPKFNTNNSLRTSQSTQYLTTSEETIKSDETDQKKQSRDTPQNNKKINLKETSANNPYEKLWSHQLIGVSTHQNAINYVNKKNLNKEDVLILKTTRAEMDWWIVLYGLYKDKQTGINNTINLPKNIDPPWLRPLKNLDVKGYIEKF